MFPDGKSDTLRVNTLYLTWLQEAAEIQAMDLTFVTL